MNPLRTASFPTLRYAARAALVCGVAASLVLAQSPIPPLTGAACPGDFVRNGGFDHHLVAGSMPSASVANWALLTQTPQVVATDGAVAPGCLLMWGNQAVGESVKQQIGGGGFVYGLTYEVSFSYRWISNNPGLPQHVSFHLAAASSEPTGYPETSGCVPICTTLPTASTNWARYTTAWYASLTGDWLTINPENEFADNDPNHVSWGEIDDICIRPVADCPNNVLQNGHFTDGLVAGDLGANGNVNGWSVLTQTPQVSLDGSNSIGCLVMWGNGVVGESVKQAVPGGFLANHTYRVSFAYRWYDNNNPVLPAYVRFRLCAAPLTPVPTLYPPTNYPTITMSPNHGYTWWKVHSDLWTPNTNYAWLTINPENDSVVNNGNNVSWGAIDDICIQDVTFPGVADPFGSGCSALLLDADPAPCLGATTNLVTSSIPAGGSLGAQVLGFTLMPSGIDLTGLGLTGCSQYVSADSVQFFVTAGPTASTASVPFSIPNAPAFLGVVLGGQSLMFVPGINPLGAITSNGLRLTIGQY